MDAVDCGKAVLDEVRRLVDPTRGLLAVRVVLRVNDAEPGAQHGFVGGAVSQAQARSEIPKGPLAAAVPAVLRTNLRQAAVGADLGVVEQEGGNAAGGESRREKDIVAKAQVDGQPRRYFPVFLDGGRE